MPTKSASKIIRDPGWLGPAIPPGEILIEEFLKPLSLGQVEAARQLGISLNRLNEIVLGKHAITADTALRLARLFKTSPQFWDAAASGLGPPPGAATSGPEGLMNHSSRAPFDTGFPGARRCGSDD